MDGLTVTEQLAAPPKTSVEKLEELIDRLADAKADDTTQRLLLTTLRGLMPTLRRSGYIPDDPAELDNLGLIAARLALSLRSDQAWQPETINDLFLGPQAPQETPEETP